MKLLKNFYQVSGPSLSHFFDATAYLLPDGKGYVLIDCGTPEGFSQIEANIKRLGLDMWAQGRCGGRSTAVGCCFIRWIESK